MDIRMPGTDMATRRIRPTPIQRIRPTPIRRIRPLITGRRLRITARPTRPLTDMAGATS